ncbi:MAG: hypothetical protein QOJ76_2439 [Acidobacteriota bacterium]|nr:hypothetical protein [Acidobacteriota bacterium]
MKNHQDGYGPTRWVAVLILTLCVYASSAGRRGGAHAMSQSGVGDEPNLSIQLGHALLIYNAALSADMRLVLTGGDGGAALWEASSGREIRRFAGDGGMVTSVAFSPDQKTVLTGSRDKSVRLWNVETGQELRRFVGHTKEVIKVAFMPDGKSIVTGATGDDGTVRIWEIATGKELRRFGKKTSELGSLAVAPDGGSILTGSFDATVRLWNVASGKETRLFQGKIEGKVVNSVAFSPDGHRAVSGGSDGAVRIWDVADGKELRQIPMGTVNSVAFSPDGRTVLTGGDSDIAQLWNVETGVEVHEPFKGHTDMVSSVAFSSDGSRILTGSADRSARLWDTATGAELMRFEGTSSAVMAAAVSADGRYLVTGTTESNAQLWDLKTGEARRRFGGGTDAVPAVAISPDGRWVATAKRSIAVVWNVGEGGVKHIFAGHTDIVRAIAFSPDSKFLLTGSGSISSTDNSIRLWDVETGKQVRQIGSHILQVNSVAFSPDGRFILSGGFDGQACLWETATGRQLKCVKAPGYVYSVAFSPDGTKFLTGHTQEMYYLQMDEDGIRMAGTIDMAAAQKMVKENMARLWDVATGKELRRFDGHSSLVHSVAFSPDGRFVLLGTGNFLGLGSNTARLFEADTGREIQQYAGHTGFIMSVMFSPDGRQVLTASADSTTRLWTTAGKEICRLSYQADDTWVVIDPERKFFDTNHLEAIRGLQWVMPDDALRPLPMEIFMRDYYEPRLLPRLIAGDKFKPVRALSELNRVQPDVRIVKLEAAPNAPDRVAVTVEVARGEGKFMQAGREVTRETGVYDLRLFRDGQMVGYEPRGGADIPAANGREGNEELQTWRQVTEVRLDAAGKATRTFLVKLPHAEAVKQVEFSAYAFNTDRVKSATARQTYDFTVSPAKGRAYLITFGVNNYESPQVSSLLYPANDARSIRDTLSAMLQQDYAEVVAVPLIADFRSRAGETVVPPTKDNLKAVLELLSGREVAPDRLKPLPAEIRDKLRAATPDDLVLISFSTHGEADERGNFYLYPHDTGLAGAGAELLRHSISSEELSLWLRDVDAGEMVMILDACYSGAATGANFKPGPMGSRGLGQLAYDKGMRLLAGTQADNVALGSGESLNGLLTTALIRDGLEKGEAARNGKIRMTDWLGYAVRRVPALYADEIPKDQQQKVQQPALFDFGRRRNSVILVLKQ